MNYTWDKDKNESNYKKHGVWFEEAQTVFADVNALELYDDKNSEKEDRYILLGLSSSPRLLIVIFCERVENEIRIISARRATNKERNNYEKRI